MPATMTLAQLLAVDKGIRQNDNTVTSELYKMLQRAAAFQGETRTYHAITEDGVKQPDARTQVVADASDCIQRFRDVRTRTMDITLSKDLSNRNATADLVVDGVTLATGVPAVTLLAEEKTADDIVAFISALPVLDPTEKWAYDENAGCYRSDPSKTLRTSKETVPLVLWEPTDPATSKHPAQVDKVVKDVPVGEWTITKFSSALPADRKRQLLQRAMKYREAVKLAREEANRAPVTDAAIGKATFDWLLAE
jgi:hypothetical protein